MRNTKSKLHSPRTEGYGVPGDESSRITPIPRSIRGERVAEMLTARDLEALLKIDVKTIYTYVQKGLIPYVRIQSNLRFIRKEILDWVDEQTFHPHAID
jgi:predicted DNA-binding transcriptional regulator AlpA